MLPHFENAHLVELAVLAVDLRTFRMLIGSGKYGLSRTAAFNLFLHHRKDFQIWFFLYSTINMEVYDSRH